MEKLIPEVKIPVIQLRNINDCIYVQMNVKSLVYTSYPAKKDITTWQGFLFKVKMPIYRILPLPPTSSGDSESYQQHLLNIEILSNPLPSIELVGGWDFPILFHPHFFVGYDRTSQRNTNGKWYDYKRQEFEKKLGDYLLRIAHSLKYDEGYIDETVRDTYPHNQDALRYYQQYKHNFPPDNIQLPIKFPSGKTFEVKSSDDRHKTHPKFQIQDNQTDSQGSNAQTIDNKSMLPSRKLKFEIIDCKPPYRPSEQQKPDLKILKEHSSDYRHNSEQESNKSWIGKIGEHIGWEKKSEDNEYNEYEFYLTKTAFAQISEHIGWGKTTDNNKVEQGGILLGHAFIDSETKITYAIAEQAIEGRLARGTAAYLEVSHETWKEMLDQMDRLHTDLQIIGWYHTHPNFSVFMSGTDKNTQARLFNNDWQFAIVLNPQQKIWRAFYGSDSDECKGFVIQENKD